VLPSGSEDEDEAVDGAFMKGPLADQMSKPMSKLKGAAFERQRDVGGMERKLIKMRADAGLAAAGGASIGQTQEKIYKEVHKIRKLISTEVRAIFEEIAMARDKMGLAKQSDDAAQRELLTQDAQRLMIDAETRANALRDRYRKNPDMNLDLMPEYLRNFLTAGVSAQTMFDRGRLEAVQARAAQLQFDEMRREERAERRRKRQGVVEEEEEELDLSDGGVPILTAEEKLFLKEVLNEAKQLNVVLQRVEDKMASSADAEELDAMAAADSALEAASLMESAAQMHRAIKRKLKSARARRLKALLPPHLKNLLSLTKPLQQMWREGLTEQAICDAISGLEAINKKIKAAKAYLLKFEQGEHVSAEEEDQARVLLEAALVLLVACSLLFAPRSLLLAPCSLLLAPCSLLFAPCSLLRVACGLFPVTCCVCRVLQRDAYYLARHAHC